MIRPHLVLVSLLALLPLLAGDDDPVAATRDRTFTRAEYGRWLVERMGHVHLDEFVTEQLVVAEAERRGLLPDEAAIDAAWKREYDIVLQQHFGGDLEAWREAVRSRGDDPDAYVERRRTVLRAELAHLTLARAERSVDDAQLRARYKDIYGDIGESLSFDVLYFGAYASVDPDRPRQDVQTLKLASMSRARKAAEDLRAGAPFAEVAATSDPLGEQLRDSGLVEGHRVLQYRKRLLGNEVDRAVESLDDPGDIVGPIQVWDGAYVIQLVSRDARTFEEARAEMEAILRDTPPTAEELYNVRSRLMEREDVRILLH